MKGAATSIGDHVDGPVPAHASAPSPCDCQTAFQKIATACVRQIRRSRRSAIAADPDAIHTMRIELTRLRAAVRFFSPMVKDEAWSPIRKELRWLNSALGNARDHDVTANYTRRKRYRSWAKGSRRAVVRAQDKAHRSLTRELTSARYDQLMAALNHWLAKGSWLEHDQRLRSEPVDVYCQAILRDWRTEIRQKGQRLRTLRRKQLHRLRIRCKRYRYMLAALQSLQVNMPQQDLAFGEIATRAHRALGDLRDLKRLRKTAQRLPPHYRKSTRKLLGQTEQAFRRRHC
ncbi:CHAD domain-containing protein [Bradyrhizobium diazoefficiens]|uniref:CHAD domain-containing protein n=1 Tax=Bradyrhizobium diazoefficiens TaxID=1355477 RepID=UPI001B5EC0B8|nr:CHAD domain-containing protein [Bradyrhizobium japonicum]